MISWLNQSNILVDTPINILPLSSLLIFASIGFIAFSIGFQLTNRSENIDTLIDEDEGIEKLFNAQIAKSFVSVSKWSAISTLLIIFSATMFSLKLYLLGWVSKLFVIIFLTYSFAKLSYNILISLRYKVKEIKEYKEIDAVLDDIYKEIAPP